MTFERLNQQYDMLYLFRRIEKNIRVGKVNPERLRKWAETTIAKTVPAKLPDRQEYVGAMMDHCNRWIDYITQNPVATNGNDYLPNSRIEQLRLKCVFAVECKRGGQENAIESNCND